MELIWPCAEHLREYIAALERGWSPVTVGGDAAIREELERIATDPAQFIALQVDREARGPAVRKADGSTAPRLPGYRRWLWDGEFCGVISLRWQPGTSALPSYCPGHIGFAVVPWKRGKGYASQALAALLPDARREGLTYVELITDVTNHASRHVIEVNDGVLVERFKPEHATQPEQMRYRIYLND